MLAASLIEFIPSNQKSTWNHWWNDGFSDSVAPRGQLESVKFEGETHSPSGENAGWAIYFYLRVWEHSQATNSRQNHLCLKKQIHSCKVFLTKSSYGDI